VTEILSLQQCSTSFPAGAVEKVILQPSDNTRQSASACSIVRAPSSVTVPCLISRNWCRIAFEGSRFSLAGRRIR